MSNDKTKTKVKVKLGKRPEVFAEVPVEFEMVAGEGQVGIVPVTFKYRTRTEFGALVNEMHSAAGVNPGLRDDGTVDFEQVHQVLGGRAAAHLLKSIDSWGLDEDLSLDNLVDLCDAMPGAATALMRAYASLCTEGRLGN